MIRKNVFAPTYNRIHTCFSTSRRVSSECPSLAFFTWLTAFERTFLRESLALLLNCLASLARFSLCSRVTLHKKVTQKDTCVLAGRLGRTRLSYLFLSLKVTYSFMLYSFKVTLRQQSHSDLRAFQDGQ